MSDDRNMLRNMHIQSWLLLAVITIVSGFLYKWNFALSVLAGGIISILSFAGSHYVMVRQAALFAPRDGEGAAPTPAPDGRVFVVKFLGRLAAIAVVLFLLLKYGNVDTVGLVLGLSTVVIVIVIQAIVMARQYFFSTSRR